MNVVLPKKIPKGHVGARLPYEPWDNLPSSSASSICELDESQDSTPPSSPTLPQLFAAPSPTSDNFVADLDFDCLRFLEFLDDPADAPEQPSPILCLQDLSCTANADDLQSFLHEEYLPALLLAAPTEPFLTRSASTKSTSSSDSFSDHLWSSTSGNNTSLSSAEESDTLNSPDDTFSFPKFLDSTTTATPWSPAELNDSGSPVGHELAEDYHPGTSPATLRPVDFNFKTFKFPAISSPIHVDAEPVDAGEGTQQGHSALPTDSGSRANGGTSTSLARGFSGNAGQAQRGFRERGDDGDDEKRPNRTNFSTPSDSEPSASDDADEDSAEEHTRRAGADKKKVPPKSGSSSSSSASSDDIPLAQRIPTALKAQKSIRQQVRQEREQRRKARAQRAAESSASASTPQSVFRRLLAGAGASSAQATAPGSQHEAPSSGSRSFMRPRTKTLPGNQTQPFSPQDLTKKLHGLDVNSQPRHHHSLSSQVPPHRSGRDAHEHPPLRQYAMSPSQSPPPTTSLPLNRLRSFRQPEPSVHSDTDHLKLSRTPSRHDGGLSPRPSMRRPAEEPSGRRSQSRSRPSLEGDRFRRPSIGGQRPPIPPLPDSASPPIPRPAAVSVVQQRVFIADMQRFNIVEIGPMTKARDVIEMVEAQGSLKGWVGSGDWMLWEIAQDFGMERPIRNYELLSDVQASWNKDKMMNAFVLKMTPLAIPLSTAAIPSASPTHAGYVEWESKRGKWSKRWLQLREHSLYLSKRDNGRDEVLLCSLSNFDAYFITRPTKAPRPFSFAIKSTDNLSFFENTADYMHTFSCSEKDGNVWTEKILLARSYVLHQEKNVLFNPKASSGNTGAGLTRSITRKPSTHRPIQPLVTIPPVHTFPQNPNDIFEPGSLLSRHAA